jgi:hypothetical protein
MPRSNNARVAGAALLAAAAALLLAACGSSTTTTVSRTGARHGSTGAAPSAPTATTTPTTSTTGPATRTSTSAAVPACTAAMLKLSFLGGQGATGHGLLGFALTDPSDRPCHTYGYPGVQFLSASDVPLPTAATRTTHDFFGTAPETAITLAPGHSASFRLGVTHFSSGGGSAGCETAAALQVIPPDDTHTLRVAIANGGAYECGKATVTPLQPGDSAYGG